MPAHALIHKKLEIHVLEVNDDRSSETEEDDSYQDSITDRGPSFDSHISVNALASVANFKTMRITAISRRDQCTSL